MTAQCCGAAASPMHPAAIEWAKSQGFACSTCGSENVHYIAVDIIDLPPQPGDRSVRRKVGEKFYGCPDHPVIS